MTQPPHRHHNPPPLTTDIQPIGGGSTYHTKLSDSSTHSSADISVSVPPFYLPGVSTLLLGE
eukprot:2665761-Rhodomonas_salina.1